MKSVNNYEHPWPIACKHSTQENILEQKKLAQKLKNQVEFEQHEAIVIGNLLPLFYVGHFDVIILHLNQNQPLVVRCLNTKPNTNHHLK